MCVLSDTTLSTSTTYWLAFSARLNPTLLTKPNISLERVRKYEIHPHPPVKVVNPDWGCSTFDYGIFWAESQGDVVGTRSASQLHLSWWPTTYYTCFPALLCSYSSVSSSSFRVTPMV